MIFRRGMATAGLVLACGVGVTPTQQAPLNVEEFRQKIRKILADGTTPSMAVAVARDGRMIWSEGFGFADREAGVAATADTPYSVASVTKPFTATAIMILAERRKLTLDDPLDRHLGALQRPGVAASPDVTIRRTLGHVAGFPVHYQYFFDDQSDRPLPFADTMRCYGAEISKPGGRYTYSNLGYGVLSETVARVSGEPYRDFLAREVFAPLGLKRASVPERAEETAGAAKRYGRDGGLLPFFVTDFPGGSALYATVEDLVRFGSFHLSAPMPGQRAILTPASVAAMQQSGPGDYGLGWSINRTWTRHTIVLHTGAMPGSASALWLVPAEKIVIAVVGNQITAPVNQLAGEILAALVPGPPAAAAKAPEQPAPSTPSQNAAGIPAGRYRGALRTCPQPEPFTIDVKAPGQIGVTLGTATTQSVYDVSDEGGRLTATFEASSGSSESQYRIELRVAGNLLEGAVTRRTSLGPRANLLVTLWAELDRER
jgi:CubicO group peptidase (beta-lactamase class C family)